MCGPIESYDPIPSAVTTAEKPKAKRRRPSTRKKIAAKRGRKVA